MMARQIEFVNIVKDNFLDDFDDEGALMSINYGTVVYQIYQIMKNNVGTRKKMIQRFVENTKCKTMIAALKNNNNSLRIPEQNSEDADEIAMSNLEEERFDSPQIYDGFVPNTRSVECQTSFEENMNFNESQEEHESDVFDKNISKSISFGSFEENNSAEQILYKDIGLQEFLDDTL